MKRQSISVRSLAEFALLSGDLRPTAQTADRMHDGLAGHRQLQQGYPKEYKAEVGVSLEAEIEGVPLLLSGRIDGLCLSQDAPLVDEIKTTWRDPEQIAEDEFPVHWAQAEIYAHMVCVKYALSRLTVRLSYFHLNGSRKVFERDRSARELADLFFSYALPYARWLKALAQWQGVSLPSQSDLAFPFDEYREGQRDMAANVYVAIREKKNLLIQAPTGIGKTAGALFPAVKALGNGLLDRIFYLTARATTRSVAEATLDRMREAGLRLRSLTLTAKEKICPHPGMRCAPEFCERARGYFDKRRPALREALALERLTRSAVEALAGRHEICPFELSLDLSEISDVVICDYNHAFDPKVKLKRFFLDKGDYCLLIDEAHNLVDRSREMLSARVSLRKLSMIRREIGDFFGKKHSVYAALSALVRSLRRLRAQYDEPMMELEPPPSLTQPMMDFSESAASLLEEAPSALSEGYFMALDYLRVAETFDGSYRALIEPGEDDLSVKLWCYDASDYLRGCLAKVRAGIFFSATLSPMSYYQSQLGFFERRGDALLDLPSPFPPENLFTLRLPLGTRYRLREQTAGDVAEAMLSMCRAKKGNYLACFPSHAYLNQLRPLLEADTSVRILAQSPGMDDSARSAFLGEFTSAPNRSMLALVAMGGIFSEGIDLPGELLSGAAIVGVGIPQIGFEREMLRQLYDDGADEGYHYAYTYPGIERVLQAAGRVIRSEADRGVVLLIDDRYALASYRALLPAHWQVRPVRTVSEMARRLSSFWDEHR